MKLTESVFEGMPGSYAALFTPFTPDNKINTEMIARIMDYGYDNGLAGFYVTGSTGEWFLLSPEERRLVIRTAVEANRGRGKIIAHIGCTATSDAVALAKDAARLGVDWVSSVSPVCFGSDFENVYRHYKAIAEATDLPFMIYSIGQNIVPERDVRLFDIPNVKGMKYTGRDYFAVQCMHRRLPKEAIIFAGCDEQLLCALALSDTFSGGIGTTYNIIPRHFAQIYALAQQNRFSEAARLQREANKVVELMIESPNWSTRKAMMRYIGYDCGAYRSPYAPLSEDEYQAFAARIAALGVL